MVDDGLSVGEATRHFWAVDRQGLLLDDMQDLRDFQRPFARPASEISGWGSTDLAGVVANMHPTIIVGTSTVGGAFTEEIVREMARHVPRPLIFPLSNPTERIEAIPADLIRWTDGRALIGTGTPWAPVSYKGVDYQIGQANNALIYPGIGLGTIVSRAAHVTDAMLLAGSEAIAGLVEAGRPGAGLLPDVANLRAASATVAVAVANQAATDGVADWLDDPVQTVQDAMWQATYRPLGVK
jgi:malate dehydrogenase (oxaloacetate-decarboxylating)